MRKKTRNILIIAIAAVLVLAIAGGTTAWYFLNDDSVVTVIKKKKKKNPSSSSSSSVEDTASGDDWVFDPEDWDVNDVIDVSSDTSGSTSSEDTESKSPYEFELDYVEPMQVNEQIGFTMYHYYTPLQWQELTGISDFEIFNYFYCANITDLKTIKAGGGMAWLYVNKSEVFNDGSTELSESWKEDTAYLCDAVKQAGLWDAVAGFHLEEAMLTLSAEQFRILTKYLSDTYPGKRIYAVLSLYEIDGVAPDLAIDPMSYRTYGYVTDIGYDWYDSNDYYAHKEYVMKMMNGVGRKNVRIWLYPTTYRRFNSRSAAYCSESLNMCYKLLMDLKNEGYIPGGIDCYTWGSYGSDDGLGRLLDKDVWGDDYDLLRDTLIDIGKKILADPYRYKETMN